MNIKPKYLIQNLFFLFFLVGGFYYFSSTASAANFPPESRDGSIGLQGTVNTAPPKQGATIVTPVNGATVTSVPITINGLCPDKLLVKIFSNNVFVGSTECTNSSFSVKVDIFPGENSLIARVYDALDQAGPDSNNPLVNFNDAQSIELGTRISLTSPFAKEGANPGSLITWPIIISGGIAPYAVNVDWGDGSPSSLISEPFAGTFKISHIYKTTGVYSVVVKGTDVKGESAYLELVGVANGAAQSQSKSTNISATSLKVEVQYWPALAIFPLILLSFWVGKKHELFALRRQLEKTRRDNK